MLANVGHFLQNLPYLKIILFLSVFFAVGATFFSYTHDYILAYGDAESHLNIAKRVVHSITPGLAQLGGIWLPLPHIMMIPLVYFDRLWRTGLAGSILSGICYVISCRYIYKVTFLLTKNPFASFIAFLIFALNPNILYLQSTPMSELFLILFFILSNYFFIKFLKNDKKLSSLIAAALFGFCATLSRYDGWFLVLIEALIIVIRYFPYRGKFKEMEGKLLLFSTLAFFGILIWLIWDFAILGDPLYFTHSQFSAKSQQLSWLSKGELPGYMNLPLSIMYYLVTAMSNSGLIVFLIAVCGVFYLFFDKDIKNRVLILLLFMIPIIFNVVTLFLGQSVIFIPSLTPASFEWHLFNVRYGVMLVPVIAILIGYLLKKVPFFFKLVILVFCISQMVFFATGRTSIITLSDGLEGLSHAKRPNAEYWLKDHYDSGLVLLDDYARTTSIIRTGIPMQKVIYIGNKPYWQESFVAPEKYARWIIMQKGDELWSNIYEKKQVQNRLYKYFEKVYTSPDIMIFKKVDN